jgi:hypothetical protein
MARWVWLVAATGLAALAIVPLVAAAQDAGAPGAAEVGLTVTGVATLPVEAPADEGGSEDVAREPATDSGPPWAEEGAQPPYGPPPWAGRGKGEGERERPGRGGPPWAEEGAQPPYGPPPWAGRGEGEGERPGRGGPPWARDED